VSFYIYLTGFFESPDQPQGADLQYRNSASFVSLGLRPTARRGGWACHMMAQFFGAPLRSGRPELRLVVDNDRA
jgi:hypothetical protein